MRAALSVLAAQPATRRVAVLGDMLELGESAADEHAALGSYLATLGIDRLVAVGALAPTLVQGAVDAGMVANSSVILDDKSAAASNVIPYLRPGDTVLVKASRGLALDTVAEEISTAPPSESSRPSARSDPARQKEDPA